MSGRESDEAPSGEVGGQTSAAASSGLAGDPSRKTVRGVLCVKCEHLNAVNLEECEFCGSHLWVKCHECGAKNRRVNVRCDECNRRLHKGRSSSSSSKRGTAGFNWWVIGMVLGGIIVMIVLMFVLSGGSANLPRLW